jgi:NTE family protein
MKYKQFVHYPLLLVCFLSMALTSCDRKLNYTECPAPLPSCPPPHCVRVALVLGGGGARGVSHVGVLEEFEKAGIPIDLIVGCSIGSIVGALYADHPSATRLKGILKPLKKWDILDLGLSHCRYGLVRGSAMDRFMRKHLDARYFSELQIPFYAVSTDLIAGEAVAINCGPIIPAVRASASVPFVFRPVVLYERILVDGGVIDPIPVGTAKKAGAEVIIAVDLSTLLPKTCPKNLFGIATRSAEIKLLAQSLSCTVGADVILRPELGDLGLFDDSQYELAYKAGKKAAREAIPEILELLSQKGIALHECACTYH